MTVKCPNQMENGPMHVIFLGNPFRQEEAFICHTCGLGFNLHPRKEHSHKEPLHDESRSLAEQIFFHVLLHGGNGNPFHAISSRWFIELAAPKISELLTRAATPYQTGDK